jgi:hypothetical protein
MPSVRLTWVDLNEGAPEEAEIRVYRSTAPFDEGSLPSVLATLPVDSVEYIDATVDEGITYYFAVSAAAGGLEAVSFLPGFMVGAPLPPFPKTYTFLSTVNAANGGTRTDWINALPVAAVWGNLTGSDRWILGTTNHTGGAQPRSKDYQEKTIDADQFAEVDAGNAYVTFSSDLVTFTSDEDYVFAYAEFFDASNVFLGKAITAVQWNDGGTGAPNIVTASDKLVPPGTRKIRFGWHGVRLVGTELSAYVRGFDAMIENIPGHASAVTVFAQAEPDTSGWTVTTGLFASRLGSDYLNVPGAFGQYGAYGGADGARHTFYKDFAFPTGWAAKVAAGNVSFLFRAIGANFNDDDDTGVRISFGGTASGVVDTGLIVQTAIAHPFELTGAVPAAATNIRVTLDFRRQDGTNCDSYIGQIEMILLEAV